MVSVHVNEELVTDVVDDSQVPHCQNEETIKGNVMAEPNIAMAKEANIGEDCFVPHIEEENATGLDGFDV